MVAVLDTHAVLWYLLDAKTLSPTAGLLIDEAATQGDALYISAISLVEVIYLVERRRLPADMLERLLVELNKEQPTFRVIPLGSPIAESVKRIPRDIARYAGSHHRCNGSPPWFAARDPRSENPIYQDSDDLVEFEILSPGVPSPLIHPIKQRTGQDHGNPHERPFRPGTLQ